MNLGIISLTDNLITQFFINSDYESSDRFDMAKLLEFVNEDNYDPITSRFIYDLTNLEAKGNYVVQNEESRPELLSYKIYGSVQYWWVLSLYNGIFDTDEISAGDVISYPNREDIEDLFFSMKAKETAN